MSKDPDDRDLDPEVIADLQLRAATERQRGGSRGDAVYQPPVFVESWRCRAPKCEERIPVTADVVERLCLFNSELLRRGDMAIPFDQVLICDDHRAIAAAHRIEKLRERHDRLRDTIRKVKASANPRRETELIAALRKDHHPDVEGLLAAVEARNEGKTGKSRRPARESL